MPDTDPSAYIEGSREAAKEFDSRVFWLAGGSIALSLTFYQSLAQRTVVRAAGVLLLGWIALVVAIVAVMVSFQLSVLSCNAFTEYVTGAPGDSTKRDAGIGFARRVAQLNWVALVSVGLGILVVLVFFLLNS